MTDRAYIVSRTLENKIAMAENNGNNDLIVTLDVLKDILALLKEQETVEHACEILRSNGWKETEPICSECDAIHVVLCKDCKRGSLYCTEDVCGETLIECNRPALGDEIEIHVVDWFCADGKRR